MTGQPPRARDAFTDALVAQLRAERGYLMLTQREMAARCGISQKTYERYEQGDRSPVAGHLAGIARALGISVSEFVQRVEARMSQDDDFPARVTGS